MSRDLCICGGDINPSTGRFFWGVGGLENVGYITWDLACPKGCGDQPIVTLTNRQTQEQRQFTPNELLVEFGDEPE